jgi:hypothetical protein
VNELLGSFCQRGRANHTHIDLNGLNLPGVGLDLARSYQLGSDIKPSRIRTILGKQVLPGDVPWSEHVLSEDVLDADRVTARIAGQ